MQVLGVVVIAAWSLSLSGILFFTLKKVNAPSAGSTKGKEGRPTPEGVG